mmetsp:Transcript_26831/g.49312  ORF Transcript_26831/g.49312 Transcript_26831/m.49312 type:complete len:186 (-) Transcript_26831:248-805(-)|eukprot:CAMPEP_0175057810 /NCGR_PEP_ID=MMETSP0052_2-20121109/11473_1 /TAXON_ID=51329 ORGANISM="Polytomella parva, Strain SAG 63-3" /NCGR_SAMPLE_ID=MMETSP0052_2 /ASSEMBLY_ACC=CAM_ASM_000194 /LENGTH=185 /DNA_ID=CAMNT_0016323069 /DNA_START=276 /DNA_END=833 /DNA_ORIENTATION=+
MNDLLLEELKKEAENGRLLALLTKLNFVLEKSDMDADKEDEKLEERKKEKKEEGKDYGGGDNDDDTDDADVMGTSNQGGEITNRNGKKNSGQLGTTARNMAMINEDDILLRLFKSYCFDTLESFPADEGVDWGRVMEALTKVNVEAKEEIVLTSKDESVILVVSYSDVKRCLERRFSEIVATKGK